MGGGLDSFQGFLLSLATSGVCWAECGCPWLGPAELQVCTRGLLAEAEDTPSLASRTQRAWAPLPGELE